jgi:hypothetical protein
VLVATVEAGATPRLLDLDDPSGTRTAALVARLEAGREGGAREGEVGPLVLLVHPGYDAPGREAAPVTSPAIEAVALGAATEADELEMAPPEALVSVDERYDDPIAPGRWLAAFAPVGRTPLVVVVQRPSDAATEMELAAARTASFWTTTAVLAAVALYAGAGWVLWTTHGPRPGPEWLNRTRRSGS